MHPPIFTLIQLMCKYCHSIGRTKCRLVLRHAEWLVTMATVCHVTNCIPRGIYYERWLAVPATLRAIQLSVFLWLKHRVSRRMGAGVIAVL